MTSSRGTIETWNIAKTSSWNELLLNACRCGGIDHCGDLLSCLTTRNVESLKRRVFAAAGREFHGGF